MSWQPVSPWIVFTFKPPLTLRPPCQPSSIHLSNIYPLYCGPDAIDTHKSTSHLEQCQVARASTLTSAVTTIKSPETSTGSWLLHCLCTDPARSYDCLCAAVVMLWTSCPSAATGYESTYQTPARLCSMKTSAIRNQ